MAKVSFELVGQGRAELGKAATRRLRKTNVVPAVLYGAGGEVINLGFNGFDLHNKMKHEAFYSHILTVKYADKTERAVIKAVQREPVYMKVIHLDLLRVSETQKLRMQVPLHFVGGAVSPGVKLAGGVIAHHLNEVEIACLPKDLPEFIEIDMSAMEIGDIVHLSDLKLPEGVEVVALGANYGAEHNLAVVSIHHPTVGGTADEAKEAAKPA